MSADACPRCGASFHCGVNDAAPCACFNLGLSPETIAALRSQYTRCVCLRCLAQVEAGEPVAPNAECGPG